MGSALTGSETFFLNNLGFTANDVFDARGMSKPSWQRRAKEAGKDIVLGNQCRNGGHRLKTRAGHCLQCDPKRISFQTRFGATAHVYIAGSLKGKLIKVGTCVDCGQRWRQLRAEGYGGYHDWQMLSFVTVDRAGEAEHCVRQKLAAYTVGGTYFKDGYSQDAYELLRCPFEKVSAALSEAIEGHELENFGWFGIESQSYNFVYEQNELST